MKLNRQLMVLAAIGCHSAVSRRGKLWRAHVNMAGNYWDDAKTPEIALDNAVELWEKAGRPMDGYASSPQLRMTEAEKKSIRTKRRSIRHGR